MRFGVREIADVTFKALQTDEIGGIEYKKGQPVLYIDTAKTSTVEGAATTVYATGGRGNSRLIAWEGERTLTFTVEDALLSPISFAVLSGAGLFDLSETENKTAMVHKTIVSSYVKGATTTSFDIDEVVSLNAPIFVSQYNNGSVGDIVENVSITWLKADGVTTTTTKAEAVSTKFSFTNVTDIFAQVIVDFYVEKEANVMELQIDAENFAGYYYVEASTLFRREEDGRDLPATLTFPRVKIQSNFSFAMAATGDPSTFTFTMDAFPAYTMFDKKKKVLCAIQVVDPGTEDPKVGKPVTTLDTNATSGAITEKVDVEYLKDDSLNLWVVSGTGYSVNPNRYLFGSVDTPDTVANGSVNISAQPYLTELNLVGLASSLSFSGSVPKLTTLTLPKPNNLLYVEFDNHATNLKAIICKGSINQYNIQGHPSTVIPEYEEETVAEEQES